jgi:hypothetical protein
VLLRLVRAERPVLFKRLFRKLLSRGGGRQFASSLGTFNGGSRANVRAYARILDILSRNAEARRRRRSGSLMTFLRFLAASRVGNLRTLVAGCAPSHRPLQWNIAGTRFWAKSPTRKSTVQHLRSRWSFARRCRAGPHELSAVTSHNRFCRRLCEPFRLGRNSAPRLSNQIAFGEPQDRRAHGVR